MAQFHFMTFEEALVLLQLEGAELHQMVQEGKIRALKNQGALVFDPGDVQALKRSQMSLSTMVMAQLDKSDLDDDEDDDEVSASPASASPASASPAAASPAAAAPAAVPAAAPGAPARVDGPQFSASREDALRQALDSLALARRQINAALSGGQASLEDAQARLEHAKFTEGLVFAQMRANPGDLAAAERYRAASAELHDAAERYEARLRRISG